jgi:ribonuclease HI
MSNKRCITNIYTDGSCLKNPGGPSGWSFCILNDDKTWLVSGGIASSTNNRMELTAVIEALATVVSNDEYKIFTDSLITLNCAQKIWKRKSNLDLWEQYDKVSNGKKLHWEWVKGHDGNEYNELVDKAARNEAKKYLS